MLNFAEYALILSHINRLLGEDLKEWTETLNEAFIDVGRGRDLSNPNDKGEYRLCWVLRWPNRNFIPEERFKALFELLYKRHITLRPGTAFFRADKRQLTIMTTIGYRSWNHSVQERNNLIAEAKNRSLERKLEKATMGTLSGPIPNGENEPE